MYRICRSTFFALLVCLAAIGCRDLQEPTADRPAEIDAPQLSALTCGISITAPSLRCGELKGRAAASILIGGQERFVTLAGTNVSFDDATNIWAADVTVTSHLSQAMASYN